MKNFKITLYEGKTYLGTITIAAFSIFTAFEKAKYEYPLADKYSICQI